jgi:hypothetical protein
MSAATIEPNPRIVNTDKTALISGLYWEDISTSYPGDYSQFLILAAIAVTVLMVFYPRMKLRWQKCQLLKMNNTNSPVLKCRGLNCECTNLIDAHIIPKGFARFIRGDQHNMTLTLENVARAKKQLGYSDKGILCADCDHKLGELYDDYAINVCRSFQEKHTVLRDNVFELSGVDGDRFARFVLSILWRGSISSLPDYGSVKLGKYENIARDILFGAKPLSSLTDYQVLIARYKSRYFDPIKFYSIPVEAPFNGMHSYGFGLAGFRIMSKLDPKPLQPEWAEFILNGSTVMRGFFIEIESTTEFQKMAQIQVAHINRSLNDLWQKSQQAAPPANLRGSIVNGGIMRLIIQTNGEYEIWIKLPNEEWKIIKQLNEDRISVLL